MEMSFSRRYDPLIAPPNIRRGIRASQTLASTTGKENDGVQRRFVLKTVDKELSKGKYKSAVTLVKQLQGKPGGLIGFRAAKQVPTRIQSLEDLNITEMETSSVEALRESIMDSIRLSIQLMEQLSSSQPENPVCLESYSSPEEKHQMCMQHEAGHFLAAYLLGIIPRAYRLPSVEVMKQENVGGSIDFPFADFMTKVEKVYQSRNNPQKGKKMTREYISIWHGRSMFLSHVIKSKLSFPGLKKFVCVTLGGLVAEHLVFGRSMGLHFDVKMLGGVFGSLDFTADEAYTLTKWAALNTLLMLHRHGEARSSLAEAMAQGSSVGVCIDTIEKNLNHKEI